MLADELDYVIGVDTHRDEHVAGGGDGAGGCCCSAEGDRCGRSWLSGGASLRRAAGGGQAGVGDRGHGQLRRWPGPLSERAGRSRARDQPHATRRERRLAGKDDSLDAVRTARAALASETLALPRAGEQREALRLLLVARRSAVDVRREALTQLRAVIVTAPEPLRAAAAPTTRSASCSPAAAASAAQQSQPTSSPTRLVLRSLARRIQAATLEAAELEREILARVRALAPSTARRARRRSRSSPPN